MMIAEHKSDPPTPTPAQIHLVNKYRKGQFPCHDPMTGAIQTQSSGFVPRPLFLLASGRVSSDRSYAPHPFVTVIGGVE